MSNFERVYKTLNKEQREAVDTIDGPLMVIAGPGTGKTQLLSVRVANILRNADVEPRDILCMTFTDNAARNMRERLETVIEQSAYHVNIHTFHSFGSDIISQYTDFFTDRQLLQQIDELGRYELLRDIFEQLPHDNPLKIKIGDDYIMTRDTSQAIGWLKQNAITPKELHALIESNHIAMEAIADLLSATFEGPTSPKLVPQYKALLKRAEELCEQRLLFGFPEYMQVLSSELRAAIETTPTDGRYAKPMTAWRNRWCEKNAEGKHVLKDAGRNIRKMHALGHVYEKLNEAMCERGLYDFDDMIVETVHALEQHDGLRFTLQEKYQYILVDEFQDTNKAQLRILQALGNNPVHEGKPNIMVVGDDDQAIYAFQGAEASNMTTFLGLYPAKLITLKENYRSSEVILDASYTIADQIDDRLTQTLNIKKKLIAKAEQPEQAMTQHSSFVSELAQYQWIADDIASKIKQGVRPHDIAVIAPRHRYLERLMPYLGEKRVPVAYERRENILEAPLVVQLITMAKLIVVIQKGDIDTADALLAEVLSYQMWKIPDEVLVKTSVKIYNTHSSWLDYCTTHSDKSICAITSWFVSLARLSTTEPLEYILDELLGPIDNADTKEFTSPLRRTLFNTEVLDSDTDEYLTLLGQLSSLRHALRQWKPERLLLASDLVEFADLHERAGIKIIDNNPHTQTTDAVQVMTAYKAKGLEFSYVYIINAQDEVWGPTTKGQHSRIKLPVNLPIAPASDGDNDKLRLLFVALTRARHSLFITSYTHTLDNKLSPPLSFLLGEESSYVHPIFEPAENTTSSSVESVAILSTDWAYRYRQVIANKPTIFAPILADYKLSVTHMNNFLNLEAGGPGYFLTRNLLRFPEAPTPAAAYGDAVHKTIQWAHNELRNNSKLPTDKKLVECFVDLLRRKHLRKADFSHYKARGSAAITRYFKEQGKDLLATDLVERGFNNEGVVVAGARLSGKIDKLRIRSGEASVTDFKTGKPAVKWEGRDQVEKLKLHRYRQQLLFYKLLVEGSASYHGKVQVTEGELAFIEANDQDKLVPPLKVTFEEKEISEFVQLIQAVWQHVMDLNFPDVSEYPTDIKGVLRFEEDLREGTI